MTTRKMSSRRRFLATGIILAAISLVGCSDSSTTPRATDPYPNSRLLVSGTDLAAALTADNQVIVDTRSADAYAAGHIPGAISLPITPGSGLFDRGGSGTDATDLKPAADLAQVLGGAGVSTGATIVVYGTDVDWLVGRMFWMLEYLGAGDVRLLDGGFSKWTADSRSVTTSVTTLESRSFAPSVVSSRLVDKAGVMTAVGDPAGYSIVDSRNAVDYQSKHIPHAVNVLMEELLNADKTMKTAVEIGDLLQLRGVTRDKVIYTHCYVGYRSSQEYFVFRLMGYDVAQYDGSWAEWSADPETPKEP